MPHILALLCAVVTVLCLLVLWGVIEVRALRREMSRLRVDIGGALRAERQITAHLLNAMRAAHKLLGIVGSMVEGREPVDAGSYQSGYHRAYNRGKHDPSGP